MLKNDNILAMINNIFDISKFVDVRTIEAVKADLVNNFIKRRKEYGYTQKQLSIRSGVSYASIRRFEETGEISFSSLLLLANAINKLEDFDNVFNKAIIKDINIK